MELRFIAQGLDPESNSTAGNLIIESLIDEQFHHFNAFVAFVSIGGLNNILHQLNAFKERGGSIRLFVGVDLNGTSKEALEKLIELRIETYIVFSPNNIVYHPKIYAFEGETFSRALVGSSNLTERGLFQSIESSVYVQFHNEDDEIGIGFLASIYEHYNQIINNNHPSCQLLTPEVLGILVANKIVLPEILNRHKQNKINNEYGAKDPADYDDLLSIFKKIKPKRPPRGYKKVLTKEEIIVEQNRELNVINEVIELPEDSMWVETGKMTGGSKNQLDISKRGVLHGESINGSVSYFGIDPDDIERILNIDLHLGNKIYRGNTVKYTPDNNNWRIQLKGITNEGERLTSISRTRLGNEGGFVNKILLFSRIDENNYNLQILDLDNREVLIENSSIWGKMGNETTGRAFGFI